MRVDKLALEDFRNYSKQSVEFAPGLNLVVGRNAQGKTNLLEAVHCLGGLGSPRTNDALVVREGAERALLHAEVVRRERIVRLDLEFKPGRGMRALINKSPIGAVRDLAEFSAAVYFGPDELELVKGPPDRRRRFLDDLVVKLRPVRDGLRREWERILRQRNALLKSAPRSRFSSSAEDTLRVWDDAFSRAGGELAAARIDALTALLPYARKRYEAVAGEGVLDLEYKSDWIDPDVCRDAVALGARIGGPELAAMLQAGITTIRDREIERGISLTGPHRDDIVVRLSVGEERGSFLDARSYASQGDQRTAALSLKLAEHDLVTESLGEPPVLLLDDVFSELDPVRRSCLADAVKGGGQTLLSSAEPEPIPSAEAERLITVTSGRLSIDGF